MLRKLDDLLNTITMYRLVLYSLAWLVGVAIILSVLGVLHYSPIYLAGSLIVLLTAGYATNTILAKLYGITANYESGLITTLILFFVFDVPSSVDEWLALGIAAFVAIASKYVVTWRGAHIFNPVALGAVVASLTGLGFASWWVGTPTLFPFVLIIGLLILRKTRRFGLFFSFFIPSLCLYLLHGGDVRAVLLSYPLVFFGMIMLTEPATSPNTNRWRLAYGAMVGLISGAGLGVFSAPQVALLFGNILAFVVSFRVGTKLHLVKKTQLAPDIYDFAFKPDRKFTFLPGQYMDWTLPDIKFNSRGNRRTFTIASSPEQNQVHIGVRFYDPGSQFKKKLINLQTGDTILGGRVAGDFVLPRDASKKLVFVAGGIGITPFVAMLTSLIDTNAERDIVLFYFVNQEQDIVYKDVLKKAQKHGLKTIPMIGPEVRLNQETLQKHVPDFTQREYYLSGPPAMVRVYKSALKKLSVKKINTDYFSGY